MDNKSTNEIKNKIKIVIEKNGTTIFNSSLIDLNENKYLSLGKDFKKEDAVSINFYIPKDNPSIIPIFQQKTLMDEGKKIKVGLKKEENEVQEQFLNYKRFQKKIMVFKKNFGPFSLFIKNEENSLRFLEILPLGEVKIWDIVVRSFEDTEFFLILHQQWNLHCYRPEGGRDTPIRCEEFQTKKKWPEMVTLLNFLLKNSVDIPSTPPLLLVDLLDLKKNEIKISFSSVAQGIAYGKDFKRRPVRIHWSSLKNHDFVFLKRGTKVKYELLVSTTPADNPAGLPLYEAKEVEIVKQ